MRKTSLCLLLIVLFAVLLTGCCLSHEWADASCTAPKTCVKCGETEGEPLTHVWKDATCSEPKTCTICNLKEGATLPHTASEATCVEDSCCTICGALCEKALGHSVGTNWEIISDPTATKEGVKGLKCTRCDEVVETMAFRAEPEEITVLTPSGFVMTQEEYHQHLLRYLSMDYIIEKNYSSYKLSEDGDDEISIYWSEGDKDYQDNVAFLGDAFSIERVLEELVLSIDPEISDADMDKIMDKWVDSRYIKKGDMIAVPLHTGILIIYKGSSGHQAMFCTLQYYLESFA